MPYELLDHTADLGIRVTGDTLENLFETAGRAMFAQIADTEGLAGASAREIQVGGMDREDLLINWLRELLCFWTIDGLLVKDVRIHEISDFRLRADVFYDDYDSKRHEILKDIKAVTYHNISVVRTDAGWTADIIFDV
jgi:SHS2 domain-containing protein